MVQSQVFFQSEPVCSIKDKKKNIGTVVGKVYSIYEVGTFTLLEPTLLHTAESSLYPLSQVVQTNRV